VVSKQSDAQGTASRVTLVTGEERVQEIARMLGGEKISDTTRAHAREMLETPGSLVDTPNTGVRAKSASKTKSQA
jgi:DNA repair protein RecN (Recombination protein N)